MYICHLFDMGLFDIGTPKRNTVRYVIALYDLATLPFEWQVQRPIPFRFHFAACNGTTPEIAFYNADMLARMTNSLEPLSRMESRVLAVRAEQERVARGGELYLHHPLSDVRPLLAIEAPK